ncbi:MAG: metalloregulator ArsR/SmtB family transcription factor [Phycisphaerales bacterium]
MNTPLEQLALLTNALADPNRLRLLAACLDRERCVCQLVALIDLSGASVSKHLAMLKGAGLLESRREGRWVHYRLPDQPAPPAADALAMVRRHALGDEVILRDRETLTNIDAIEPCELARMQREGCCPDMSCSPPARANRAVTE